MYHGDIRLGDTIDIKFTSRRFDTGAPATLASSPVISAYVGNGTTEITAGITLTVDFDSRTGLNNVRVVATSGNGYATATNVQLVITTGTVNSVSVVGEVVGTFSIECRSALMPTTAARTLVVDASGLADANTVKIGPTGSGTAQTAKDVGGAVPAAAAGASGGLLISGSNSGTTTLAALTVTGVTTLTGNVVLSDGLTVSAPSTLNRAGITITGNGTGQGIKSTGGATADGVAFVGGATGQRGALFSGLYGIELVGAGNAGHGLVVTPGTTSSHGFFIQGGATSGDGINVITTSGHGVNLAPAGTSKHGLFVTGGNGGTSDGIKAVAGTGGVPIRGDITGNITGNLSGSVGSIAAAGISAASFASDVPPLATRTGTAQAGDATHITLDAGASASDDFYNNQMLTIYSGTGAGQSRQVLDYVGATKVALVATWVTNPDNTSKFFLIGDDAVSVTVTDKTGYSLTAAYDAAKTAAQAGDAMALTAGERNSTADALLDRSNAIETGITPRGALRLSTAMSAGKTNGMDTAGTAHVRDVADSKNRVTATVDGAGNRTATSVDVT